MNRSFALLVLIVATELAKADPAISKAPQFTEVEVGNIKAWRDYESGLIIGNIKDHVTSLREAEINCPSPWRVPNFGKVADRGASGDLVVLFEKGILSAVLDLVGRSFWLKGSPSPYYETLEFTEDATHPLLYNYGSADGSISSICIVHDSLIDARGPGSH